MRIFLLLLTSICLSTCLHADDRTKALISRLTEEAAAFERIAPKVLGTETLQQRALKSIRGVHLRIGAAAQGTPDPKWQERTLVSEYGFAALSSDKASDAATLHELRNVISVDGRKVKSAAKNSEQLAEIISTSDDKRKKALLKQFEQYGLLGAATDFGQLILLFSAGNIGRYEFGYMGQAILGSESAAVFSYRQIDGPNPLTVVDANHNKVENISISGEIWVRAQNYTPLRITFVAMQGSPPEGPGLPGLSDDTTVRQEGSVDYKMSPYGAVLPTSTHHRELRGGNPVAENTFTYTDFKRFGASSEIVDFTGEPAQ